MTRLATGAGRHTLWALPQADPDLAATVVTSPADPTVAAEVAASASLGRELGVGTTTGIAWPVDGSFESSREAGLRTAYASTGLQAIVGSSSALPVTSGFSGQAPRRTGSGLTLLAWDDVLSRLSTQTTTAAEGALTTQRFVAETAAILNESPGVARTFLMAMPRTARPRRRRAQAGARHAGPDAVGPARHDVRAPAAGGHPGPGGQHLEGLMDRRTATRRSTPPG